MAEDFRRFRGKSQTLYKFCRTFLQQKILIGGRPTGLIGFIRINKYLDNNNVTLKPLFYILFILFCYFIQCVDGGTSSVLGICLIT